MMEIVRMGDRVSDHSLTDIRCDEHHCKEMEVVLDPRRVKISIFKVGVNVVSRVAIEAEPARLTKIEAGGEG